MNTCVYVCVCVCVQCVGTSPLDPTNPIPKGDRRTLTTRHIGAYGDTALLTYGSHDADHLCPGPSNGDTAVSISSHDANHKW